MLEFVTANTESGVASDALLVRRILSQQQDQNAATNDSGQLNRLIHWLNILFLGVNKGKRRRQSQVKARSQPSVNNELDDFQERIKNSVF